ncbi:MAG TPA: hypothetical protein VGJ55_07675 [Pyrinomonadaceae bacterium]|jgi:hypothetical protein
MTLELLRLEAQLTLDDLLKDQLIPFELTAQKIESDDSGEYVVRFYDSRLFSITVAWEEGQSFRDIFRAAVMERVKGMRGPLTEPVTIEDRQN